MAETKTNNLGSVQGNLTAAYNARKKREDLYKKGYAVSPDKAKRDEYAAIGAEMDANYNTGFQEIRRLEEEAKSIPKFRSLTSADKERLQKIKEIKKQIPLQTRLAQELLPKGLVRSREIAPLKEESQVKEVDLTEEEIPTITVSEPKREAAQKLYRVMFAGEGPENSIIAETKEEADRILKESGKKGAVAGVNMRQKTRGGEKLTAEQSEKRSEEYINQMLAPQEKENKRLALLEKYRSPEYKKEILAKRKEADDANLERYKNFVADIDTKRNSQATFNAYNKSIGLLKSAYSKAKQAGDFGKAFELDQKIKKNENDVPKEMGARKKYFERIAFEERNARIAEDARIAEETEKRRKISAANPDYSTFNNPFNNAIGMRYQ